MKIADVSIIEFPKICDPRGKLSFFEGNERIPFKIKRAYWIYDVPGGESRGSHAFKESQEVIISLSGSFDVVLHDGTEEQTYSLNRSYYGLYVPRLIWRTLQNFSTNSLALVVSDHVYDKEEYIRDFDSFTTLKTGK